MQRPQQRVGFRLLNLGCRLHSLFSDVSSDGLWRIESRSGHLQLVPWLIWQNQTWQQEIPANGCLCSVAMFDDQRDLKGPGVVHSCRFSLHSLLEQWPQSSLTIPWDGRQVRTVHAQFKQCTRLPGRSRSSKSPTTNHLQCIFLDLNSFSWVVLQSRGQDPCCLPLSRSVRFWWCVSDDSQPFQDPCGCGSRSKPMVMSTFHCYIPYCMSAKTGGYWILQIPQQG